MVGRGGALIKKPWIGFSKSYMRSTGMEWAPSLEHRIVVLAYA
jgi:hypothetical protein